MEGTAAYEMAKICSNKASWIAECTDTIAVLSKTVQECQRYKLAKKAHGTKM